MRVPSAGGGFLDYKRSYAPRLLLACSSYVLKGKRHELPGAHLLLLNDVKRSADLGSKYSHPTSHFWLIENISHTKNRLIIYFLTSVM